MAVKNLYGLTGQLALAANSVATIIKVDATLAGAIAASGFANGTDQTYFAVTANNVYEVVRVTAVNGQNLTVVRGIDSTAQAFPVGSKLEFVVTAAGVLATIGPIASTVQLTDSGLVTVSNTAGDIWNVDVPVPAFAGTGGISILGTYPNLTWTFTAADCCGDAGVPGTGGLTAMEGSGIASAFLSGGIGYVSVSAPAFTGVGCTITGAWPNYTITVTGGGGAGSVTSIGVLSGLTLTGNPAVNPTISITNTGVVAGSYGGVTINARGQIEAVPSTFNPISILTPGAGVSLTRAADNVTIALVAATVGVAGVVMLVDPTDPYDPTNATEALTPAALQTALATLSSGAATGASNFTGEADGDYTNTIAGSALAFELATGKKAIIHAEVTMVDGTTPLTPVAFAMAIFNSTPTRIRADRKVTLSKQSMSFLIEGPIAATTYAIATTALPVGSSIVSYSLYIQKLP